MKKYFLMLFLSIITGAAGAGGAFELDKIKLADIPAPSQKFPQSNIAVTQQAEAEWTVIAFLNGKNDLEDDVIMAMNDMEKVGSGRGVNIIAELALLKGWEESGGGIKIRRYRVEKDYDYETINSEILEEIRDADMGDWTHLRDFVLWAKRKYPAKHYALIMHDHSSGWRHSQDYTPGRDIGFDDDTMHAIRITQLGTAFASMGKIDVFFPASCFMQNALVLGELYKYADFLAGSEEMVSESYYAKWLGELVGNPQAGPEEFAKSIVSGYKGDTVSAIRSGKMPDFIRLAGDFASAAEAAAGNNPREAALYRSVSAQCRIFGVEPTFVYESDSRDLGEFLNILLRNKSALSPEVSRTAEVLLNYIDKELVIAKYFRPAYAGLSGISVYLPDADSDYKYYVGTYKFIQQTGWDRFLRQVFFR